MKAHELWQDLIEVMSKNKNYDARFSDDILSRHGCEITYAATDELLNYFDTITAVDFNRLMEDRYVQKNTPSA